MAGTSITTDTADGDVVSLSVEALAIHLRAQISGLTVIEEWPYGNQALTYPALSIFAGKSTRAPMLPVETVAVTAPDVDNKVVATEVVAEYDLTMQLDLWTRNKLERKQQLAKLLTVFTAEMTDNTGANNCDGLTLILANYFNMPVRYEIQSHEHKDDEQAAERQERRETIMVIVNLREIRTRTYYAMRQIQTQTAAGSTDHTTDDEPLESHTVDPT